MRTFQLSSGNQARSVSCGGSGPREMHPAKILLAKLMVSHLPFCQIVEHLPTYDLSLGWSSRGDKARTRGSKCHSLMRGPKPSLGASARVSSMEKVSDCHTGFRG